MTVPFGDTAATASASADAYEFEKLLVSVREACVIVRAVDCKEGQELLQRSIDYGLLEGEGSPGDDDE